MYFLPHIKRSISNTKTNWLMLFAEIIALYYEHTTKDKTMDNVHETKQ
jgi:hypothetical protein